MPSVTTYTKEGIEQITDEIQEMTGVQKISEISLAATAPTLDFTTIPQEYKTLKLLASLRGTTAAAFTALNIALNNNTTDANYYRQYLQGSGATASSQEALAAANSRTIGLIPAASANAANFAQLELTIVEYGKTGKFKPLEARMTAAWGATTGTLMVRATTVVFANTAPIDRLTLIPGAGDFAIDSVASLYGVKSAFG